MSLEYLSLCEGFTSSYHRTMEKLFQQMSAASHDQSRAHAAAILIQRHWRGYRDRTYINYLHRCALHIQVCYRAHRGRIHYHHQHLQHLQNIQHQYYHVQARLIQKIFRGYYSRKYAQDFHQRKKYINTVQQKGEDLHEKMETTYQQQVRDSIISRQQSDEAQFTHLTENIHHLMSTKAIPGVFAAKYGVYDQESKVMAYEKPMEEHIQYAFVNRQQRLKTLRETMLHPVRARPLSDDLTHTSSSSSHSQSLSHTQSHTQSPSHTSHQQSSTSISSHPIRGSSIRAVLENGRREITSQQTQPKQNKWDLNKLSTITTPSSARKSQSMSISSSSLQKYPSTEEKEDIRHDKDMNMTATRSLASVGPVQIRRKWAHPITSTTSTSSPLNGNTILTKNMSSTTLISQLQPYPSALSSTSQSQPRKPSKPRPQSQPQQQMAQ